MFEIVSQNPDIDFLGIQRPFLIGSGIAVVICILAIVLITPAFGIDFEGGTEIIVKFSKEMSAEEVRENAKAGGINPKQIQRYGAKGDGTWLIQTDRVSVVSGLTKEEAGENGVAAQDIVDTVNSELELDVKNMVWSPDQPKRMELEFPTDAEISPSNIAAAIEAHGLSDVKVTEQSEGGLNKFQVEFQGLQPLIESGLKKGFSDAYNPTSDNNIGIQRLESVGPQAGDQLRNSGIASLLIALFCILIYIALRFDIRYAPGAVAALTHDIIIAIGFFTFTQLEISLPIIAALLTIIGYSLNDTIVVFDRIRENLAEAIDEPMEIVSNTAINQTLSRTLITSLTTLLAVVSIAVIASGLIQNFAIALIVGVLIGTYSSVFVATPVMLAMNSFLEQRREANEILDKAKTQQTT
jgi:preprotein translocase subunit SecF